MKKLLMLLTVLSVFAISDTYAQKISLPIEKEKLAKADAEIENPKKNIKASTWIKRGDTYVAALRLPTKGLYNGLSMTMLEGAAGKGGKRETKVMNGAEFNTIVFPYFVVYMQNNTVVAWTASRQIDAKATDKAIESYKKALEIDPSVAMTVKKKLVELADYYKELGTMAQQLGINKVAADQYVRATNIQKLKECDTLDPLLLYYAGYYFTIDGETTPQSFIRGEASIRQAIAAGYCDIEDKNTEIDAKDRGNVYYYAFHCAYAQKEKNKNKIKDAKKWLVDGAKKYPNNERIFEGLLTLYTTEEGVGDPAELLPALDKKIAANNNDEKAWFARGRIYNALENYDECVKSFENVVRINPKGFDGNYYLGTFYLFQSDSYAEEVNGTTYTDMKKLDADMAKLNGLYARAIAPLEAAHAAKPKSKSTLEFLKTVCFRLRDENDEIMKKYEKYNKLYNEL